MGNVYLAGEALFKGLGIEYVTPPFNSRLSLEIGSKYSPEEICLPFKIVLGNFIQSIKKGADTIITTGSCGPCRYGEYCELQMNILRKIGYDVNFIVVDYPKDIGMKEFIRRISKVMSGNKSVHEKISAVRNAYKVINLADDIESRAHYTAGIEKCKGQSKKILYESKINAEKCSSSEEMVKVLKSYKKKLNEIEIDTDKNPIRIAIIGEIYTIIESFANMNIEDKLMDYGVSSKRFLTPSWWVKNALLSPIKMNSLNIKRASKHYLPYYVGGHAKECIGEAVLASEDNFDGVIQIMPLGCMPEVAAEAILKKISKDKNIPIMTLIMDEMTGEAGYITRIEAFIDLLERRRKGCII